MDNLLIHFKTGEKVILEKFSHITYSNGKILKTDENLSLLPLSGSGSKVDFFGENSAVSARVADILYVRLY